MHATRQLLATSCREIPRHFSTVATDFEGIKVKARVSFEVSVADSIAKPFEVSGKEEERKESYSTSTSERQIPQVAIQVQVLIASDPRRSFEE